MAKHFLIMGRNVAGAVLALTACLFFMTGCDEKKSVPNSPGIDPLINDVPVSAYPVAQPVIDGGYGIAEPLIPPGLGFGTLTVMARTDPANPQNERFLDSWRFEFYNIDDEDRRTTPSFFAESGPDGTAIIGLPDYMFQLPLVIHAYNEAFPLWTDDDNGFSDNDETIWGDCRHYQIFVPPFCADKAVWLAGPFEDRLWGYYRQASRHRGEAWDPSQVDCATWLLNLQNLILSDRVYKELQELSDSDDDDDQFSEEALILALQENQQLLTPTRPPICMAERRHFGGGMERDDIIPDDEDNGCGVGFINLDGDVFPFGPDEDVPPPVDDASLCVNLSNGLFDTICDNTYWASDTLVVNGVTFTPTNQYLLDDRDFPGSVHDQSDIVANIDLTVYNTRLGNGRQRDMDFYDQACAATSIIRFTNTDDDEQDIFRGTGVTFTELFPDATSDAFVYLTSDGDAVVDDSDIWAIFYAYDNENETPCSEQVLAVELLGHREEDFRDVLHMVYDIDTQDLFLGLRADFELNEEEIDGEEGYLAYTIHVWDGSTIDGRRLVRQNISNCYEAADVWARQFFVTLDFNDNQDDCCIDEGCDVADVICPLRAAEFAVRSQCFSNSRSNQRWRTDDAGYWSINTDFGVEGDVVVNPGWLAPFMDFEIYIQKFDEAVFKGPRTVVTSNYIGEIMVDLPTLVEGDRVLIRAEDSCCDDYDLVLPCVPEFTGFAGFPGIPYVPATLGPPPVPPIPVGMP